MTFFILLIAFLHAIPVFLAGIISKNKKFWVSFWAILLACFGIATGQPAYMAIDLISVIIATMITFRCINFFSSFSSSNNIEETLKNSASTMPKENISKLFDYSLHEEYLAREKKETKNASTGEVGCGSILWSILLIVFLIPKEFSFFYQKDPPRKNEPREQVEIARPTRNNESREQAEIARPTRNNESREQAEIARPTRNSVLSDTQTRKCIKENFLLQTLDDFLLTQVRVIAYNNRVKSYVQQCTDVRYPTETQRIAIREAKNNLPTLRREAILLAGKLSFMNSDQGPSGQNDITKEVQIFLNYLGFNSGLEDGLYGNQTKRAIEAFQAQENLLITGAANRDLWKLLIRKVSNSGT